MAVSLSIFGPEIPPGDRALTRAEFARLVGTSTWRLLRLHQEGTFKAFACSPRGGRGYAAIYLQSQVDEYRSIKVRGVNAPFNSMYTAEQAQACFKAFDEGKSGRWCVSNVGVHPDVVGTIRTRYEELDQGVFFPRGFLQTIHDLGLDGPEVVESADDIVELLKKSRERIDALEAQLEEKPRVVDCKACGRSPARFCKACVSGTVRQALAQKETGGPSEESPPARQTAEAVSSARQEARDPHGRSPRPSREPDRRGP